MPAGTSSRSSSARGYSPSPRPIVRGAGPRSEAPAAAMPRCARRALRGRRSGQDLPLHTFFTGADLGMIVAVGIGRIEMHEFVVGHQAFETFRERTVAAG